MKNTLFLLLKAIEEIDISDKAVAAATIECNTNVSFFSFFRNVVSLACREGEKERERKKKTLVNNVLIEFCDLCLFVFAGNYRGSTLPKQHKRINIANRIVFWEEESSFLSLKPKKYII